MRALVVLVALARVAAADPWTVPGPTARASTIDGTDELGVDATALAFGAAHTLAMRQQLAWHAARGVVTMGAFRSTRVQDGVARQDDEATVRAQVERALAFEGAIAAALATRTFTRDQPIAIDPATVGALGASNGVTLDRMVVTWTGGGGPAHFRVYASFALDAGGRATVAGGFDYDAARGALVDVRIAALVATDGLARLDAHATAHLHRTLR